MRLAANNERSTGRTRAEPGSRRDGASYRGQSQWAGWADFLTLSDPQPIMGTPRQRQEVRAILGTDLPFEVVSQKLDLPELQVRATWGRWMDGYLCVCIVMYCV